VQGDDDFLARWSRRKAAARRGETAGIGPAAAGEAREAEPDLATVEGDAELPKAAPELPDIATLDGSSDYRPFLQAGVPKELRREALRKLWRTNPIINSLDGLDDHYITHDFTDGATVVADLRTAYRVGKGMLGAVEEPTAAPPDPPVAGTEPPATPTRLEPHRTKTPTWRRRRAPSRGPSPPDRSR
jgi:hypothetical protein